MKTSFAVLVLLGLASAAEAELESEVTLFEEIVENKDKDGPKKDEAKSDSKEAPSKKESPPSNPDESRKEFEKARDEAAKIVS